MAKASYEEWERVFKFTQAMEDEFDYGNKTNEELGAWVRKNFPPMTRVVFGYRVLVDNCCDPNESCLEWRPDLAKLLDKNELKPEEKTNE